jgi:thiol-disulfide isomerase/thioredoxin
MKKLLLIVAIFCVTATVQAQHIPQWKMTDLVKYMNQKSDTILVINFWATFCKPCVAEIPDFINVANKYKNQRVKLLLVSLDFPSFYPAKIATFAAKHKFTASMVWLNETNADYFCPMIDSSWSGAIPATLIVNTKTGYKKFFEAEMKGEELEGALRKAIGEHKTSLIKPKFFMPMNEVVLMNWYGKYENLPCNSCAGMNKGITFQSKESTVYSIDSGTVSKILNIEGMQVIIIEKNKLSFTYSNLKSVFVKVGDMIKSDYILGYADVDLDGIFPTLDLYLSDMDTMIVLSNKNFNPRNHDNSKDHSFDPIDEPE